MESALGIHCCTDYRCQPSEWPDRFGKSALEGAG